MLLWIGAEKVIEVLREIWFKGLGDRGSHERLMERDYGFEMEIRSGRGSHKLTMTMVAQPIAAAAAAEHSAKDMYLGLTD